MSTDAFVKELAASTKRNAEGLETMTKAIGGLVDSLSKTRQNGHPNASDVFGSPHARRGEDPLTSRGFSFMKMIGLVTQACKAENAVPEMEVHREMAKVSNDAGYSWAGMGQEGGPGGRFLAPLSTAFLPSDTYDRQSRMKWKSMVAAGVDGADHDEMRWIRQRQMKSLGYSTKAMSWLNELTGGALVAPPEMGELIELLRNKEALVNAGARVVPLPPQGRLKYPRQTSPSLAYWIGEHAPIPDTTPGVGEVTLQGKKLAVRIIAPNELIRFASPAAEALLRDDMTKSLALGLDLAGLEGTGGDHRPRGVINLQNITKVNSSSQTGNGDAIIGTDIYRMIAAVEENNAEFEGWIMRPKTLYRYYQLRADAVGQGDNRGLFLFNLVREAGDGVQAQLGGYPVTKSTQISQVRSKGTSSALTYVVGGMWSDLLIGMFGAIEFAATTMGDTSFTNDQTWVRGILTADIAARHDISFVFMDNLDPTIFG